MRRVDNLCMILMKVRVFYELFVITSPSVRALTQEGAINGVTLGP